jgi:hypothetical protein
MPTAKTVPGNEQRFQGISLRTRNGGGKSLKLPMDDKEDGDNS